MSADFYDLILSYLHDPPDKALDIKGHERRAARLASVALDEEIRVEDLHARTRDEDILASVAERIPLPSAGPKGERAVGSGEDQKLLVFHPLSGRERTCDISGVREGDSAEILREILAGVDAPGEKFLLVWRYFRERLAEKDVCFGLLPADTRIPDHSIWNHLDISAGWKAALSGVHGAAFLMFSLGPVQNFIAAARSLRDLWTGSYMLSWITFQAMIPVLDACGPTAFVFPALRGVPLVDVWLSRRQALGNKVARPAAERLRSPCLPNRFLALVPSGQGGEDAREMASRCERACREALQTRSKVVFEFLDPHMGNLDPAWGRLWDEQIASFFEVRTVVLPLRECEDKKIWALLSPDGKIESAQSDAAAVRRLAEAMPEEDRPKYGQGNSGRWAGQVEIAARSLAAARTVRHVPEYRASPPVPQKCSVLGSYEQLGPPGLEESNRFWGQAEKLTFPGTGGARIRNRERLCAISMFKRFAWPVCLAPDLEIDVAEGIFQDTATVAAQYWLEDAGIEPEKVRSKYGTWNGQWLHWTKRDPRDEGDEAVPDALWERIKWNRKSENLGRPPAYYAVLQMDGDDMGQWLAGERGPTVRESLHPRLREYFEGLSGESVDGAMHARRPLSPALHAAISEALSNFALHFVPGIVNRHRGLLIYAGGDDVLAVMPLRSALSCAVELRSCFAEGWKQADDGRVCLLMGEKASASTGLAVVHHKEDLRAALQAARHAEQLAKRSGKDSLALSVWRRSGEHAQAVMEWGFAETVQAWTNQFMNGASNRWAYRLRQEIPVLEGLELGAFKAEIRRLLNRTIHGRAKGFCEEDMMNALDRYRDGMLRRHAAAAKEQATDFQFSEARIRADFVTLLQSASFLARGRDD